MRAVPRSVPTQSVRFLKTHILLSIATLVRMRTLIPLSVTVQKIPWTRVCDSSQCFCHTLESANELYCVGWGCDNSEVFRWKCSIPIIIFAPNTVRVQNATVLFLFNTEYSDSTEAYRVLGEVTEVLAVPCPTVQPGELWLFQNFVTYDNTVPSARV